MFTVREQQYIYEQLLKWKKENPELAKAIIEKIKTANPDIEKIFK